MKFKRRCKGLSPWDMRKQALKESEKGNREAAFGLLAAADEEDNALYAAGSAFRRKEARRERRDSRRKYERAEG